MKILLTAFEPFGGETINPSILILENMPHAIGTIDIVKAVLPVAFIESTEVLTTLIDTHQPDCVLSLGQAGGRSCLSVEKVAINFNHARIPDNSGEQPLDQLISVNHPDAYFSTLPVNRMVKAMLDQNIPASLSFSAGTYVCNHVMFVSLAHIQSSKLSARAGFIHIPFLPVQVIDKPNQPSMSLDDMTRGIIAAIQTFEIEAADITLSGGTTH